MKLKFYYYDNWLKKNQLITEFDSDVVPRVDDRIKFGKKKYLVHSIVFRMKGDGSKFLHARINLA